MAEPFFSIVIANFNSGTFLAQAIESVTSQSCDDYELIVVDGGSTDDSVAVIRRYEDRIEWWCSEKDRGQSHAFTKGFAQARGRFLTWLNADDLLLPQTLEKAKRSLQRHPQCQWLAGNTIFVDDRLRIRRCAVGPPWVDWIGRRAWPCVYGPTTFFHRDLLHASRGFDETLHYSMDSDLWCQFQQLGIPFRRLRHFCWAFRLHAESKTSHAFDSEATPEMQQEHEGLVRRYQSIHSPLARYALKAIKMLTAYPATALLTWRWRKAPLHDYIQATGGSAARRA
jgi:glycosyltransferase involved in cell wall biosynthesis